MLPSQLKKCNIAVIIATQMELQVTFLADTETKDQSSDGTNTTLVSRLGPSAQHEGPKALDGDDDLQALGGELVSLQPSRTK